MADAAQVLRRTTGHDSGGAERRGGLHGRNASYNIGQGRVGKRQRGRPQAPALLKVVLFRLRCPGRLSRAGAEAGHQRRPKQITRVVQLRASPATVEPLVTNKLAALHSPEWEPDKGIQKAIWNADRAAVDIDGHRSGRAPRISGLLQPLPLDAIAMSGGDVTEVCSRTRRSRGQKTLPKRAS